MTKETNLTKALGVRQRTHNGIDMIMDKAESMRNRSMGAMTHLKERAIMKRGNVDNYIQENPEKSVLLAAGIGVVVGAIIIAAITRRKH